MRDAYRLAHEIESAGRDVRRLAECWCPRSNKLVAALVAHRGQVVLWTLGGRAGSNAEMIEEWDQTKRDFEDSLEQARLRGDEEIEQTALAALTRLAATRQEWVSRHLPAISPSMAVNVSGGEAKTVAACRGCRRDATVTAAKDDSGRWILRVSEH